MWAGRVVVFCHCSDGFLLIFLFPVSLKANVVVCNLVWKLRASFPSFGITHLFLPAHPVLPFYFHVTFIVHLIHMYILRTGDS